MKLFWLLLVLGSLSWVLTGVLRRYALAKSLLDVPNDRSSHTIPTPRGGGISIVVTFTAGLALLWAMSLLGERVLFALLGSGLVVAVIGFIDDHGHIAARWRLLGHFTAAIWLVILLGGLPPLILFGFSVDLGWAGHVLAVVALVWLLNLYNFMDGIDGIAGIEALSSTLVAGLFFLFIFDQQEIAYLHLLIFASVAGFLVWNFPPAKIFMGDVGSGFLGLMLGALALQSAHIEAVMLWVWLILLGIFFVDATFTLIRRLLNGEKIYEAHRSHAYQYASRKCGGHMPVTLSVLLINLFWLTPWAAAVALNAIDGTSGMTVSYLLLIWLAWYYHAGKVENK